MDRGSMISLWHHSSKACTSILCNVLPYHLMPLNHTHQSFNRETLLTQPHTLPRTWSRGRKPDLLLLWMLTSLRSPFQVTSSAYRQEPSDFLRTESPTREPAQEGTSQMPTTAAHGGRNSLCVRVPPGITAEVTSHLSVTCPDSVPPRANRALPRPGGTAPLSPLHCLRSPPPLHPPAASRSWLLYVSPAWLTPLALVGSTPMDSVKVSPLILTALPAHLVTADPSARLSRSLPCCVLCSVRHISPLITLVPRFIYLFIFETHTIRAADLSDLSLFFFVVGVVVATSWFQKRGTRAANEPRATWAEPSVSSACFGLKVVANVIDFSSCLPHFK